MAASRNPSSPSPRRRSGGGVRAIRRVAGLAGAAVVLLVAGNAVALAGKPGSVPPSGSTCGAFYGSVVSHEARSGALGADVNPGILHQGLAGAEAFPFFKCP